MPGRRNVVEVIVGLGLLTPARYTVHEGGGGGQLGFAGEFFQVKEESVVGEVSEGGWE